MSMDVVDLRNFYGQALGAVARRFIGRGIRRHWRDLHGMRALGIGYATPYLGLFREGAERCLAFMPAAQGVVKWPSERPALAALVDELDLPLTDAAVDRILLVHALEMSPDAGALLREVWRRAGGCSRSSPTAAAYGRAPTRRRSATGGPIRAGRSRTCCGKPGSRRPAGARHSTRSEERRVGKEC